MFVSFLFPFRAKNLVAPYLWVLYKQISHFSPDEIIFVGTEEYFQNPSIFFESGRSDISLRTQECWEFDLPSFDTLNGYRRYLIPSDIFATLEQEGITNEEIVKRLLISRYERLETEIARAFDVLVRQESIEAVLTWCNVTSLSVVATSFGLPVIHNELGPLRKPCYHTTAYLDFKGVNGHTEAASRFERFRAETLNSSVPVLSKKELLDLYLLKPVASHSSPPEFEIGIPLQVENDTNIIAFSNGWNNQLLIENASASYGKEHALIRRHPYGLSDFDNTYGVIDNSLDSVGFLQRCKRIATINSSVGLEAMLFDRETCILGDSPFAFAAANSLDYPPSSFTIEEQLQALNFILFGYLIPFEYLFEPEYLRWRLSRPCETEIYEFNLKYIKERHRLLLNREYFRFQGDTLISIGLLKFCFSMERRNKLENMRRIDESENHVKSLQQNIQNIQHTLSWRLTEPLRFAGRLVGWRGGR